MSRPLLFATGDPASPPRSLAEAGAPLDLAGLLPGSGPLEIEIGFGKGRFLLRRATESPERRFLGIEIAHEYFSLAIGRARRRGLANVAAICGDALYLASAVLPRAAARVVHVYFPDPWPKLRHHKRRLFDPATVDLVLGLLEPGGELCFATDFLEYGERVRALLESHPAVVVERRDEPWPDGARTNYEAKYLVEGRPILRLAVRLNGVPIAPHPAGDDAVVNAWSVAAEGVSDSSKAAPAAVP